MTLYNRVKLANLLVLEDVKAWYRRGLVPADQVAAIVNSRQPAYKRSHVLYRIGVFLLTTIILYSSSGILVLILEPLIDDEYKLFLLAGSCIVFGILYHFIRHKDHFKSGVDDALLYNGLFLFITAFQLMFNHLDEDFLLFLVISSLPFILLAAVLFIDRLLSVAAFAGFICLVFLLALKAGDAGKMLLPFLMMAASVAVYFVATSIRKIENSYFWSGCLDHVILCSLAVFYLSGNYYVVREASVVLMNAEIPAGGDIPFAIFFYAFTIIVPLVYIYLGLRKKLYGSLNLGLLFFAASILTIRHYHHMMPFETALLLGGMFLLSAGWWVMHYLRTPKYGITYEEQEDLGETLGLSAEALVIAQSFGPGQVKPQGSTEFGGGEFGGGGAGSKY